MTRVLLALFLLGATRIAAAEGGDELFLLSYEIEKAGEPLAAPTILVRADELGSITLGEEETSLKLVFWVSPGTEKARVSTQVDSKDISGSWEGTVEYSRVQEFQFNDVRFRLKVERHVAAEA